MGNSENDVKNSVSVFFSKLISLKRLISFTLCRLVGAEHLEAGDSALGPAAQRGNLSCSPWVTRVAVGRRACVGSLLRGVGGAKVLASFRVRRPRGLGSVPGVPQLDGTGRAQGCPARPLSAASTPSGAQLFSTPRILEVKTEVL